MDRCDSLPVMLLTYVPRLRAGGPGRTWEGVKPGD